MRSLLSALLLVTACQAGVLTGGEAAPGDAPPLPGGPDAETAPIARAVLDTPRHGQIHEAGDVASVRVHGWTPTPGETITLQALADGAWVDVGAAISGTEPGGGANAGMVELATTLSLESLAAAWPAGGVVRLRARGADGGELAVFGDDRETDGCLAAHGAESWTARANACAYPVTRGLAIVRVDEDAAPRGEPPYLDLKGAITAGATATYYAATDAAATLGEFRTRYGFGGADEVSAAYYNVGDLAVGRDMHCVEWDAPGAAPGLACYSSNYGEFSGDPGVALAAALDGYASGASEGAFATVAMVYAPPIDAPNSVSFVVFGADGERVDEALLDQIGDNVSVPNNCLNCHGSASAYDPATSRVTGARFLPFDPGAMEASDAPGFTFDDQAESFRRLNALVGRHAPAPGVGDFLAGLYPDGVETVGARIAFGFVPPGWASTIADRTVYREVIAPMCRGCHQTHVEGGVAGPLAFRDADAFRGLRAMIGAQLCAPTPGMPNAEVVFEHLRTSAARAYVVDYLDLDGACAR